MGHNDGLIRRLAELVPTISCVRGFQVDATGNQEKLALHQCRLLKKCLGEDTQVLALMDKGSTDAYWEEANRFSVLGCRVYHEAGLKNSGAELTFRGDLARGNRETPYLVLETQCQGRLGQLPYPGQLRLWAFHHIASAPACATAAGTATGPPAPTGRVWWATTADPEGLTGRSAASERK